MTFTDKRYAANMEHAGHAKPSLVLRFCGEWVGIAQDSRQARQMAKEHAEKRIPTQERRYAVKGPSGNVFPVKDDLKENAEYLATQCNARISPGFTIVSRKSV